MEKFSQKYAIVQFIDKVEVGDEFVSNAWPLHVTIIDTFAIGWTVDEMIANLTEVLHGHLTASSVAEDDSYFGESGQVQVTLVRRSESLIRLHLDVAAVLEKGGLILNDPQYACDGFLPHATVQNHARLMAGDHVRFTSLSIIDMFPGSDPFARKVVAMIDLGA